MFFLGGGFVVLLPPMGIFAVNVVVLIAAALALFGTLLFQTRHDLMRMILTGIIFGTLFRSLTGMMQRMIDPNEFAVIQVASFARFSRIETGLLALAGVFTLVALIAAWAMRHRLDVLGLGS